MSNTTDYYNTLTSTVYFIVLSIGVFALGFSITYILFLFGVDVLDISGNCKYAITKIFLGIIGLLATLPPEGAGGVMMFRTLMVSTPGFTR